MSCLFDSIQNLLMDELPKNIDIRNYVCQYIKNNFHEKIADDTIENWLKIILENEFDTNSKDDMIDTYIKIIENTNQWGGGPELSIISKAFNIIIKIQFQNQIIATFNCSDDPLYIIILDWNGGHYEPCHKISI